MKMKISRIAVSEGEIPPSAPVFKGGFVFGDYPLFATRSKVRESYILPALGERVEFSFPNPLFKAAGEVVGYTSRVVGLYKRPAIVIREDGGTYHRLYRHSDEEEWRWAGSRWGDRGCSLYWNGERWCSLF